MRTSSARHAGARTSIRSSWSRLFALGVLGCLAGACSRSSGPAAPTAGSPVPGARPGGAAVWAGVPLRGNSTEALRAYLNSVEEIKPKRFEVQWNPATVAIDKAAALRSLRTVSRDGATFTFAADEPAVAKLKTGSILWVWDIAVRKVDSVETIGGVTRVSTSVVKLNEAMPNAQIEFEAPVKLRELLPAAQGRGPRACACDGAPPRPAARPDVCPAHPASAG